MASGLSIELGQIEQTLRNWVKTFDAAKVNAEEIGERDSAVRTQPQRSGLII
jgi:hypothetical protein